MAVYLKGTRFNSWSIASTNPTRIRRLVREPGKKARWETLSKKKYRHLEQDLEELKKFVVRLNAEAQAETRAKAKVELKHAYIDEKLKERYRDLLLTQIPSRKKALEEYVYVVTYFLNFFIGTLDLVNPLDWHRCHKIDWAKYLKSEKAPAAASTKKHIVRAANKFMKWLHEERPSEVPALKFEPLSRAMYRDLEARRVLDGKVDAPQLITPAHWKKILESLPDTIEPFVHLAYNYGLRRAETLGLEPGNVRKGHLEVAKQLVAFPKGKPKYGPLKGREVRSVPHWFASAAKCYDWISSIYSKKLLMHPDQITHAWGEFMDKLGYTYGFHDLRHTFITNAVRRAASISKDYPSVKDNVRDVQLAAGHKNIETTMRYLHDDRSLDDELFVPEAS